MTKKTTKAAAKAAAKPAPIAAEPLIEGETLGAHVSTQGGPQTAPVRAAEIGASALQMFTKTPNQWREPAISPETAAEFKAALAASGVRVVVSHDSYLINLASPDPTLRTRSIASFIGELERCAILGIPFVVSHPGNFIDDREAGLARNAEAYAHCLSQVKGPTILIETTAGSGTALGANFEELADLRARMPKAARDRVAFCADSCHLYSAGYDLVNDFDGVWNQWEKIIGLADLRCFHLNDSMTPFNSRRDRHQLIAEGSLGAEPFRRIMSDPRFAHVVKLIETPKGDDPTTQDRAMLARLRSYTATAGQARRG